MKPGSGFTSFATMRNTASCAQLFTPHPKAISHSSLSMRTSAFLSTLPKVPALPSHRVFLDIYHITIQPSTIALFTGESCLTAILNSRLLRVFFRIPSGRCSLNPSLPEFGHVRQILKESRRLN